MRAGKWGRCGSKQPVSISLPLSLFQFIYIILISSPPYVVIICTMHLLLGWNVTAWCTCTWYIHKMCTWYPREVTQPINPQCLISEHTPPPLPPYSLDHYQVFMQILVAYVHTSTFLSVFNITAPSSPPWLKSGIHVNPGCIHTSTCSQKMMCYIICEWAYIIKNCFSSVFLEYTVLSTFVEYSISWKASLR